MAEINADGLKVRYFTDQAELAKAGQHDEANTRTLCFDIGPDSLWPAAVVGGDLTIPHMHEGAFIKEAYLKVLETFTAAGAATLTIGTADKDGTAIDADGIDASIALAALAAGNVVRCDGAQVVSAASGPWLQKDAWVTTTVGTGPFTAGKAVLVVRFIEESKTGA